MGTDLSRTGSNSAEELDKVKEKGLVEPGSCSHVDCYGPSPEQIKRDAEALRRTQEAESRRLKNES